jgi:hypothetical protein
MKSFPAIWRPCIIKDETFILVPKIFYVPLYLLRDEDREAKKTLDRQLKWRKLPHVTVKICGKMFLLSETEIFFSI